MAKRITKGRTFVGLKVFNKFIFKYQGIKAWNKADKGVANTVLNVQSPCFTSEDWIVRWGRLTDPVFATRVQKMYLLTLKK